MLDYQESSTGLSLAHKSFVSPNPVPTICLPPRRSVEGTFRFVFIGSLFGGRDGRELFDALESFSAEYDDFQLDIFGMWRPIYLQ